MNFYRNRPAAVPAMQSGGAVTTAPAAPTAYAPLLAVPYVLPQVWEKTYEPAVALQRGTIFPSLDLPFLGIGGVR